MLVPLAPFLFWAGVLFGAGPAFLFGAGPDYISGVGPDSISGVGPDYVFGAGLLRIAMGPNSGGQSLAANFLFGAGPMFSFRLWPQVFFSALASWPHNCFFDAGPGQTSFDLV